MATRPQRRSAEEYHSAVQDAAAARQLAQCEAYLAAEAAATPPPSRYRCRCGGIAPTVAGHDDCQEAPRCM